MASNEDVVLATLKSARAPQTVAEIKRFVDIGETSIRDALGRLERSGTIVADRGKVTLWSLANQAQLQEEREARVPTATAEKAKTKKAAAPKADVPRKVYNGNPGDRQACAERDEKVLKLLQKTPTGLSKNEVAEKLELPLQLAYNSLSRLQTAGEAVKERDGSRVPRWKAA